MHNCSQAILDVRVYVTRSGRLYKDGRGLKKIFLQIGYNKKELEEAKDILNISLLDRDSDKKMYTILNQRHKDITKLKDNILERIKNKLKEFE